MESEAAMQRMLDVRESLEDLDCCQRAFSAPAVSRVEGGPHLCFMGEAPALSKAWMILQGP